jgi:hypothetical protein
MPRPPSVVVVVAQGRVEASDRSHKLPRLPSVSQTFVYPLECGGPVGECKNHLMIAILSA